MKWLFRSAFAIVLLFSLFIFSLPALLSTNPGKRALLYLINQNERKITFSSLSLSWLGPQVIEGLCIEDASSGLFLSVRKIHLSTNLFYLCLKKKNVNELVISEPCLALHAVQNENKTEELSFVRSTSKSSSLPHALPSNKLLKTFAERSPFPFKGRVLIEKGALFATLSNGEKIQFLDLSAHLFLPSFSRPQELSLSCQTSQNNHLGNLNLTARLNPDDEIEIDAKARQLPISGIDYLLAWKYPRLKGVLLEGIGETLDLQLKGLLSKESFQLSLSAGSDHLIAEMHTKQEKGTISFLSPATLSLSLTPDLMHTLLALSNLPDLSFHSGAELHLQIPAFTLPLTSQGIRFQESGLEAHLSLSPTSFTLPKRDQTLLLKEFKAVILSKNLKELISGAFRIKLSYLQDEASVDLDGEWKEFSSGQLTAHIDRFPLALLDKKHYVSLLLGNSLSGELLSTWAPEETLLRFHFRTPYLTFPQTSLTLNQSMTLDNPVTLSYRPPEQLFDFIRARSSLYVTTPAPLTLSIEELKIPLGEEWKSLQCKGELSARNLLFLPPILKEGISLPELTARLEASSLEKMRIEIESSLLQTELFASLSPSLSSLDFKKPVHLKYLITDPLLSFLSFHPLLNPQLETPALCDVTLDPFSIPLNTSSLPPLLFKGEGRVDELKLKNPRLTAFSTLDGIGFTFLADQKNSKFLFDLSTKSKIEGKQSGTIALSLQCAPLFSSQAVHLTGKCELSHLKVQVLEDLFGIKDPLLPVLGPTLNLVCEAASKDEEAHFLLDMQSENLKASTSFLVNKKKELQSEAPTKIEWKVTKEGFAFLHEMLKKERPPFTLDKTAILKCSVSRFYLPLNLDLATLEGEVLLDSLSLEEGLILNQLKARVDKKSGAPIKLSLEGKSQPQGDLNLTATFNHLVNDEGRFSLDTVGTEIETEVRQFPTPFVDLFFKALSKTPLQLTTLLGEKINASLRAHLKNCSGALHLNFHSDRAKASLEGQLQDGILTLTAPVHAQFQMTQDLSKLFLKKANPLKISSFTSKDPITVQISDKGFSLPLYPLKLNQLNLPEARLELGKIACESRGNLKTVLKLLKSSKLSHDQQLELWFTPIDLKIYQGVVHLQRTDILLADSLQIALWGVIDLSNDSVKMILGLTKPCLERAFSLKNLPPDYVLQLPLTGTTRDASLNKVAATAKIATLLAWREAFKEKEKGSLWGDLLGTVASLPDKDNPAPPSKNPLPWDQKQPSPKKPKKQVASKNQQKAQEIDKPKKNRNPLKEFFKAIK